MSNARQSNVIIVDTSAQFSENLKICSVKYIGNTSGTASIKLPDSSGTVVWEASGTTNVQDHDLEIRAPIGCYVTVTNSAKVYLYLA